MIGKENAKMERQVLENNELENSKLENNNLDYNMVKQNKLEDNESVDQVLESNATEIKQLKDKIAHLEMGSDKDYINPKERLYDKIPISIKSLDIIIKCSITALVAVLAFAILNSNIIF